MRTSSHDELVIFDFDGVIALDGGSWSALHKALGTVDAQKRMYAEYQNNGLTFREWTKRTVGLWTGQPASTLTQAMDYCRLTPGIADVIAHLNQPSRIVGLVSGGVKQFIEQIQLSSQFEFIIANDVHIRGDVFSGDVSVPVTQRNKRRHFDLLTHIHDIEPHQLTLVGDSWHDLQKPAPEVTTIAFNPKSESVNSIADHVLSTEEAAMIPQLVDGA